MSPCPIFLSSRTGMHFLLPAANRPDPPVRSSPSPGRDFRRRPSPADFSPSIPHYSLPDSNARRAYKWPYSSSLFPLSFLPRIRRQADKFHRRSPQSSTMNIVDFGEVRRPRLLPLASSSSLSSCASPDDLRLSYFAGNRCMHLHPKLAVTANASATPPRRS
jgi:hypothetical protein